ncbi:MAG: hypothetical protein HFE78_01215 [Clostridiales bacterium]|nr:hypothetical protein [Clostridiales bacterium]
MKKILNSIVSVFAILVVIFSFVGCSGGISSDDAKAHISDFLDAIETKDYEHAATFLHPERPADLEAFFEVLKNEGDLDFSTIEITKYTGFSSSYYDSTVGGSTYSLSMSVKAGDDEIKMEIEIVKNDNGYGIYNLDIDT